MGTRAQLEVKRIMDRLASAIVEHRLPPGTRLTEAKLVEVLGANRNHVRSALQKLASEYKVVTIFPNRGACVAQPTIKEARDVFAARIVIERAVVELAIDNLTAKNRNRLLKQLEKETGAIKCGERQEMIRESGNFHRVLAQIAGNEVLDELLAGLITRTSLIIALYQETPNVQCSIEEHQALVDAILAKDCDRARYLMDEHMKTIQRYLLLDERSGDVDLQAVLEES
ncbi:Transcriptional regulator, GntR family [Marinobacterium lacunae]|uniref:Transcriptional regulator, GntR family n=1 Tax=Marinobacterium lacunae TaxID=1232683 RepID=A0A081FT13_9GAMM|nr:GntR family transcriptional regulator [Marinobacterium lacunae]KEA61668.1 Transcriptional regulator, GntR family [Marinobacterium lacunae]MBR9882803.1 GntR family transcriptional regulator [Oceanospirillales bacterium]